MSAGASDRSDEAIEKRSNLSVYSGGRIGLSDKPDYITVKANVTFIKHDQDDGPWYTACTECSKKVVQGMGDTWQCEKCNKEYLECKRRYILSLSVADHTGTQWITLFDDQALQLLGHTAEDLHQLKLSGDIDSYEKVFSDAMFKQVIVKLRVKQEMVNDEPRLKSQGVTMSKVDFTKETSELLKAIAKYE
jgi:replication factor A1